MSCFWRKNLRFSETLFANFDIFSLYNNRKNIPKNVPFIFSLIFDFGVKND